MIAVLAAMILMPPAPGPTDAAGRYREFTRAHPTFRVTFSASLNGTPRGTGSLLVQRPNRLLYKLSTSEGTYELSSSENDYQEIDNGSRSYDNPSTPGPFGIFPSRISNVSALLAPSFLLTRDIGPVFQGGSVVKEGGSDTLHVKHQSPVGSMELWMQVNQLGEPVMLKSVTTKGLASGPGKTLVWHLTGYSFPSSVALASFVRPIPQGYMPYALDPQPYPLQPGFKAPVSGWFTSAGSHTPVNLAELSLHKPFLLAVLDTSSGASRDALQSLDTLKTKMPVYWTGRGGLSDPGGRQVARLNPPGTPTFYLIDGNGKLVKLWQGYDRSRSARFESDVLTTAKGRPNPNSP